MNRINMFVIAAVLAATSSVHAFQVDWTNWTSATTGMSGSASGVINNDGNVINVRYTGEVAWAQTNGGENWWLQKTGPEPYTGNPVIDNAPPASDIIVVDKGNVLNKITFDHALLNPVMAFVSIGRPSLGVNYAFNQDFNLLSEGAGWWGNGTWTQSGKILTGNEAHGAIQFIGNITEISWINYPGEYWHGFTVGTYDSAPVPEPSTFILLGAGLAGVAFLRRKKKA